MSNLKPNQPYIYEKADGVTYAREFGVTDRIVVGYDFKAEERQEEELWREIRKAAKTNKSLQRALDRAKILYRLSKDDPL
jgi:hypothetical protein